MVRSPLQVLAVIGSLNRRSSTRVAVHHVAEDLHTAGCQVDVLDLLEEPLPLFNPDSSRQAPLYLPLQQRVDRAQAYLLATPDYHGTMSGVLKNFLDHFWREFTGKLVATLVASHEKGLTVSDEIRTVARQCYAWSLPYAVAFTDQIDVLDGRVVSESVRARLAMLARDLHVYGTLLAGQRQTDLAGHDPGFMAKLRS